jgi:hypothetical protein
MTSQSEGSVTQMYENAEGLEMVGGVLKAISTLRNEKKGI